MLCSKRYGDNKLEEKWLIMAENDMIGARTNNKGTIIYDELRNKIYKTFKKQKLSNLQKKSLISINP